MSRIARSVSPTSRPGPARARSGGRSPPGGPRLLAYVSPRSGEPVGAARLRDWLESKLPAYMIPSAFVSVESLPLTVHGKVDRAALLALEPDGRRGDGPSFVAPGTDAEEKVAAAWAEVLGIG